MCTANFKWKSNNNNKNSELNAVIEWDALHLQACRWNALTLFFPCKTLAVFASKRYKNNTNITAVARYACICNISERDNKLKYPIKIINNKNPNRQE